MFKRILEFIECAVTGGPYQIRLENHHDSFVLSALKRHKSLYFSELPDRYEPVKHLALTLPARDRALTVPIDKLEEVKAILESLSGNALEVIISPDVKGVRFVEMPTDFAVSYVWSNEHSYIERHISNNAQHLSSDWFATANCYWRVKGTKADDNRWLSKRIIEGKEIIEFLTHIAPDWKTRKLPYVCDLKLSNDPAFTIMILDVHEDQVEMVIGWRSPVRTIADIPSLSDHVIAENVIRPGISPQQLGEHVPLENDTFRLAGRKIPQFLITVWPHVRQWTTGLVQDFISLHKISQEKCELILNVRREECEGIGLIEGIPTLLCGNYRIEAEEVSKKLQDGLAFIRLDEKWIDVKALKRAGIGPFGRSIDGSTLSPVTLTPADILRKRGESLAGRWTRIEFPSIEISKGKTPGETARLHLEFLRTWGMSGGTVGAIGIAADAIREMLLSFVNANRNAKVLVVGTKRTLDALSDDWEPATAVRFDGGRKDPDFSTDMRGIVQATPKALETVSHLSKTPWSILCLLEADTLIKSDSSNLFYTLVNCRKTLTIGMFHSTDFLNRTVARRALSEIFAIREHADIVWKFGLRDLADVASYENSISLTDGLNRERATDKTEKIIASQVQPSALSSDSVPAEYTIDGASETASLPIPTWSASATKTQSEVVSAGFDYSEWQFNTTISTGAGKFVNEAKRWVNHREEYALPIPFQSYYSTYDAMTKPQLKWYFYWRGQVRDGIYPNTDLSYIFVHVYELINNVGVENPMDGYKQLRKLWANYRSRHRNLDNYLLDWIADYLIINHCPVDPLDIYVEGVRTDGYFSHWDIVLAHYLKKGLEALPIELIDNLSDYRIRKSKFYTQGYQILIDEYVPKTLDRVNANWMAQSGRGIFDVFKPRTSRAIRRYPFQAAVYAGRSNTITVANIFPFREHPPLRHFITAVVKHTENRLREIKKFKGQLRGYNLDPEICALIDSCISGFAQVISPPPAKPKVTIDQSKLNALIKDSNDVRDMLLSNGESSITMDEVNATSTAAAEPNNIARPEGTPAHLLTDLVPVNKILESLNGAERQLIDLLGQGNWEMNEDEIKASLPGIFIEHLIDHINELSLNTLGDILIASEENIKLVVDDFRDELEYLLSLSHEESKTVPQEEVLEDLPEEWAKLKGNLTNIQLQVLKTIIEFPDPTRMVTEIAKENATMPEVLIDSINEAALDALGDIIIDTSAAPVTVEEEDIEMARRLIARCV